MAPGARSRKARHRVSANWCPHHLGTRGLCTRPRLTCRGDKGPRSRAQAPRDGQHCPWRACQRTGDAKREQHKAPCSARGASSHSQTGLGGGYRILWGLSRARSLRGDKRRGQLRDFRSLHRHSPLSSGGAPHPIPLSKWGPKAQKGTGLDGSQRLFTPAKFSPPQTQTLRRAEQIA